MSTLQALLYVAAIVLVVVGAFPIRTRVSLALIGAACALCAYALPTIDGAL